VSFVLFFLKNKIQFFAEIPDLDKFKKKKKIIIINFFPSKCFKFGF
jgi:hypothetical protein